MKALGIAFSARKRGNCLNCIEYVLARLKEKGLETEVINAYKYEIKPCSHCNYECFAHIIRGKEEECPVQDDVQKIYKAMQEADVVILAIPTYSGKPAGIYSAFKERAQGVFKGYEEFKSTILNKIIALIVIGNVPAGGDLTYHSVILDHYDCKNPPPSILLQSAEYSRGSLYGDLLEDEKVRDRLDNLVKLIFKSLESKR
ncbi:MAG: flavodoxin family protein [Candidatus Bathyarchaeota archaeon]|jgi:multimeric flavodoxin WrbA|nr:flavodoxin family protein [Candidatus Bathyarchaeota archaeon A05DMB-3]MDH7606331.1 flavodoxin family protein [Candidatus Bathyarchaeota archaeon]